jgi:predicted TPR repeat methyltransferase
MTDRLELFDSWAEHYDELLEDETGFPFEGYSSNLERAVALADPAPGSSVLDLGAGTGALASRFLKLGSQVTGVDFSAEMLRRAQARFPQAAWLQADLLADWPEELSSGEFDPINERIDAVALRLWAGFQKSLPHSPYR